MQQRLSLITLAVEDLAVSRRFFEQGLGWTASAGSQDGIAFYQLPGLALALYPRASLARDIGAEIPAGAQSGVTLGWNGHSEAEVDAAYAQALAAGATAVVPPEKVFWGGYSGYVRTPDGHLLEVAFNPFWPLAEDGSLRLPGADPA
ncbi:VOC family protein [Pannonibacter tanglangensis]|uniref:VOC family protein n=1 Tax=Pannonibacter tanglangensis TaxID=2750084 RepID=A0ABW9ZFX7_9HYPH|nr:VOC family protein [Pannonibacter sp. XCT-34]NBN62953.1 VOC family protein [Pannonibacter sp. XCT-34]